MAGHDRKIAAILAADVVDYSRLMGMDEESTLAALKLRRTIFMRLVADCGGREFGSVGDSLMAQFPSAVNAVRCAQAIQLQAAAENAPLPPERRMRLRIGVDLGDVIEENGTAFGDAVNVAARLQALARPGGVLISGAIYDQVKNKLQIRFVGADTRHVKNIAEPVRIFEVLPAESSSLTGKLWESLVHMISRRVRFAAVGIVFAIAALALVFSLRMFPGRVEPSEAPKPVSAARVPSVAVLPFVNLSDDAGSVYFSDGISEELVSELARLPQLRVASRTSSFAYRNSESPLPEIARALNVDHIIEGSVRKAGNRVRVTAQLIEVASDSHLWAQTYDRELADIFSIQDEISGNVVAALRAAFEQGDVNMVLRSSQPTGDLEAYQLYLRGRHLWNMRGEDNLRQSIKLLTQAVELDPDFARAHAALAQSLVLTPFYYDEPDEQLSALAARSAARAIELDPTLSEPYAVQGMLASQVMDWKGSQAAYRQAIEVNGNNATAWYWLGESLSVAGRNSDAFPVLMKALELDPISPPLLLDIGELHLRRGDFEKGCPFVRRSTQVSATPYAWLSIAGCHKHRGDMQALEEAERTAMRMADIQIPVFALVRRAVLDPAEKPAALSALDTVSRGNIIHLPGLYLDLGEIEAALDAIERPLNQGNWNQLRELWVREAKNLRAHPRFRALVERIGLVDYWRRTEWPDACRPQGDSFMCD